MTTIGHLVVGPQEHGVVRHGLAVAAACGHPVARSLDQLGRFDVVHLPFTDRLFGATCEQAAAAFAQVAAAVTRSGASLSITLHDVPRGSSESESRRRVAYRAVVAEARGVIVCSRVELAAVEGYADDVHSLRLIPLPVDRVPSSPRAPDDRNAVVLGFVFPDRGYEQVLSELPPGCGLLALGRAAAGHEDLPDHLHDLAAQLGTAWTLSGFVPDEELARHLASAAVPIAPNVRVGASGSIGTWLAHGRRPLVPRIPFTEELGESMPGALLYYDAERPGALRATVEDALDDWRSTWLMPELEVGPTVAEVARAYRAHLVACAPAQVVTGKIPGNRWDLLVPGDDPQPSLSVVIPYHDDQRRLELVLAALSQQTISSPFDVVVADDGSEVLPDVTAADGVPVRVVRQPRRGFGAARARNLGASVTQGSVLAFLDADTVPAPDYLDELTDRVRLHHDLLVVGRRKHGCFDGWTGADVRAWFLGERAGPVELSEPQWLLDAYRTSRDLLDADRRSYRYVITAVLAMHRHLFTALGGFDESFDHYGGEDWEFAHRAWQAGAVFAHQSSALAWHDGPDWAGRDDVDHRAVKNTETLGLSRLLPDPQLRGGGPWSYPHIVVRVALDDPVDVLATVRSALAVGIDCGFWAAGGTDVACVNSGAVPAEVTARASVVVDVSLPCDLSELPAIAASAERHGIARTPALVARSTRALSRCGSDDAMVETLFGSHDRSIPRAYEQLDLSSQLPRFGWSVRRS